MLSNIRTAISQRRAYLRTKAEIESLPDYVAHDLNIDRYDAARLAAQAVYR